MAITKMASSLFTLMISIVYVDYYFANPDSQTKFYQSQLKIWVLSLLRWESSKMLNSHNGDHKMACDMAKK